MNTHLKSWTERLLPSIVRFYSQNSQNADALSLAECLIGYLGFKEFLALAMDSFDPSLSSVKVKLGGMKLLHAIMSTTLAQQIELDDVRQVMQKMADCNSWYKVDSLVSLALVSFLIQVDHRKKRVH